MPTSSAGLVLRDPRIAEVRLELAHPGDSARVLRALDAVEPTAQGLRLPCAPSPDSSALRTPSAAGRTHRLSGFTVVQVTEFPFPASGVQAFEEGADRDVRAPAPRTAAAPTA